MSKHSSEQFLPDKQYIRKEKIYIIIMFSSIIFVSLLAMGIVMYLTFWAH